MQARHISNYPYPWLTWISAGTKKYEGRLASKIEDWDLQIGGILKFHDGAMTVYAGVTDLPTYKSFGDAYDDLGYELVPIPGITRAEVEEMYSAYYTDEDIKKHGVVAIGLIVHATHM